MKRLSKLTLFLMALLLAGTASADDYHSVYIDGIYYDIFNNKACVISPNYVGGKFTTDSYYSGNIIIPATVIYKGTQYPVTSIGWGAFCDCSGLTSITIPNSVITIDVEAFSGCSGLNSITMSNSITYIGSYAFYDCSGLTSITIPNSVTTIGDEAFSGCSGLTSVTIPNSVTAIGYNLFNGCTGLTSIMVESGNPKFDSRNNCNAIISTDNNKLIIGCKNTIIPNSVTIIGSSAFYNCSGLTSITIPNSVTTIGSNAFSECSGLTSVTIPNSVTTIGSSAFSRCSNMTNVVIGKSTANIDMNAFFNCPRITKVTSLNKEPPACSSNLFSGNVYNHAVLYVPDVSVSEYILIDGWSPFIHIEGLETSDIVLANSITLDRQNMIIGVGTMSRLIATILPDTTTNKAVTWASSNPTVASVDDTGMVTAVAAGSAIITVMTTDGSNLGASCTVEVFNDMSQYSDYLSLTDVEAFHGDTIVIPVRMTNAANITAFQTDIFLPEGLEVLQEDGEYIIDPSARMSRTHSIMSSNVSNGAIRVLCYSSNYKPFTGESGDELFNITVKVADDAEGDYTIALKNTMLTNTDFVDIAAPDVAATINVKAYLPGDANDSGTVTVGDVVVTAQYVLELNPQPFNFEAADVNEDSYITVADVARIAWMVLNPTAYAPMRAPALWNNCDRMSGESIILMPGETRRVSITLDNEMAYTAFQLDLNLPEGLSANNFSLTDRADSHAFDINMLESGMMRILCYSPVLTAIGGHEGVLLTFDVTSMRLVNGDISVDGIELVTTGCQSVKLDGFAIGVNNASVVNELSAGKTIARVNYFNIAGQQIDSPENGVTLVVTTYTDGTRTTSKVIK